MKKAIVLGNDQSTTKQRSGLNKVSHYNQNVVFGQEILFREVG